MVRNVPVRQQGIMLHDDAYELGSAIQRAAVIQKLIRRHLRQIARRPTAGVSPRDAEHTVQVMSDLLETLEQNTQALQRALAHGRGHRVLH